MRLGGGIALTAEEVYEAVLDRGAAFPLANGWCLARRRAMGADRIEVEGPADTDLSALKRLGCTTEIVSWRTRVLVPRTAVLERRLDRWPLAAGEDHGCGLKNLGAIPGPVRGWQAGRGADVLHSCPGALHAMACFANGCRKSQRAGFPRRPSGRRAAALPVLLLMLHGGAGRRRPRIFRKHASWQLRVCQLLWDGWGRLQGGGL